LFDAPTVLLFGGRHIILRGHCYVRAAIKAGVTAVPARIVTDIGELNLGALTTDEFARNCVNMNAIRDWEHACGIKLPSPPSRLRPPL
jgi:ParB-like chromosome segregation protein Spo0J